MPSSNPAAAPDENTLPPAPPAAHSLAKVGQYFARSITAADMAVALRHARLGDDGGDRTLHEQAQVLDSMFHRLIARSFGRTTYKGEEIPEHISSSCLDFALQTQKLCRQTLTARRYLKVTAPQK